MPRRLRKIYDTTDAVELTFTTAERRFYLRPNKLVNAIIAGVVAVAAERYEVGVIAVVALSSHMLWRAAHNMCYGERVVMRS
jgi:hypothetical protein